MLVEEGIAALNRATWRNHVENHGAPRFLHCHTGGMMRQISRLPLSRKAGGFQIAEHY